ncbi:MAG: asparagine synthase C-terminal domain-containing protein [Betaproteobacteria bacterium]|nr:asparagine synthase C-terminal domain-containing protein [Betaproteobacteria bacterium]
MSTDRNRVRGYFEPAHFNAAQFRADIAASSATGQALQIEVPGLLLEASGPDQSHAITSEGAIILQGGPSIRGTAVQAHGLAALWPDLRSNPDAVLNSLQGRFALLWLDLSQPVLHLASDRFNTHDFCWAQGDQTLSFSNRADTLPRAARALDPQAIFNYLYFHMIPAPGTIFQGVQRLEPGKRLAYSNSASAEVAPWWKPRFAAVPRELSALKQEFRDIVRASVAEEMAEPGVAAYLSGGTDSSTVVGMMREVSGKGARCYSIGFDAAGYDEMAYARIAAKAFGADHREFYVTAADLVANIPSVAAHYDQPFGNSSALPAFCLAKLAAADGYTKLLAGDGGDELFGGNTRYAKQRIFNAYYMLPSLVRAGLIEPLTAGQWAAGVPILKKAKSYVEQAKSPLPDRTEQYNLLFRLGVDATLSEALSRQTDCRVPMQLQRSVWNGVQASNDLERQLGFDWRFTLADNDLPKVIGTTSLAGLAVGFPLLADKLVDFSLRLPPELKLKGMQLRWFFKEALRGFLPDEIITKQKHGFGLPFGQWALADPALKKLATESVHGLVERGILRGDFVERLLTEHLPAHPGYYGEMVWISMMLEQWLQAHAPESRF